MGKLADSLQRSERRSLEQILSLGGQVCEGLSHLHRAGIIHRDVSPANIFFDESGSAHLGDFDSAISLSELPESLPVTNNRFVSPEERTGNPLDVRSDLYSVGAVLYLCAAGGTDLGSVTALRKLRPDLPSSFADLVESLLAESPDDRPPDTGTVINWLEDIRRASDLDALLATEESDTVEFKSSLLHPHGEPDRDFQGLIDAGRLSPQQADKAIKGRLQWEVTKTVAGFLNTHGGILLVGVSPSRSVLGIEPDFAHLGNSADGDAWQLAFKELVIKRLGEAVWSGMRTSLITHGEKTVAIVSCPRRSVETWHHGGVVDRFGGVDDDEHFYARIASATHELKGPELVRWIREHW